MDIADGGLGALEGALIDQPVMEAGLRAGLSTLSTVEVCAGRSVVALEQGADHVEVGLDNGDRVRTSSHALNLRDGGRGDNRPREDRSGEGLENLLLNPL